MKTCPRCGAQYPDEFLFCSADAAPLAGASPPAATLALPRVPGSGRPDRDDARLVLTAMMVACALGAVLSLASVIRGISANRQQAAAVPAAGTAPSPMAGASPAGPSPPALSPAGDASWRPVEFGEYGFALDVPAGWRAEPVVRRPDLVRWRFVSPESQWVYLVVDIDRERRGVLPVEVWRDLDARMERGFGDRYTSLGITEATLGGKPGALWTMRNQKKGEPELMKADIGINLEDGQGLALMIAAPPDEFERYRPAFDHAVASFHWADPGD